MRTAISLLAVALTLAPTQLTAQGGQPMHATGTFDVTVTPAPATPFETAANLTRYTLVKQIHGGLEGAAHGEMLSTATESTGAMAYVALDRLDVTLNGRKGTFILLHQATMLRTDPNSGVMKIVIMKDSGTGDLTGISGDLTIHIDAHGHHTYTLNYQLP
jgi:hypothetical protein